MFSDDAWSSYNESESGSTNENFEINDEYIDDELFHNEDSNQAPQPSPGSVELYSPDELDHYFLDPEGLNLVDPFAIPENQISNRTVNAGDPEPSSGPFDPG